MLPKEVRRRLIHLTEEAARKDQILEEQPGAPAAQANGTSPAPTSSPAEACSDVEVAPPLFPRSAETADWAGLIGGEPRSSGEGCFWLSEMPLGEVWPRAAQGLSVLGEQIEACPVFDPEAGPQAQTRRERSEGAPRPGEWPRELKSAAGHASDHFLFLDIETAGAWSVPLFLIGTLDLAEGEPFLRFFLARHYEEERWLLDAFSRHQHRFPVMVTFNGRTFDWPYIADRLRYHRMKPGPVEVHLDILPLARKRWRKRLPNCRLITLERAICRRVRLDDLPSEEIPGMYHRFVAEETPDLLVPILRHNAWDLVTTAELLLALLLGREPME